MTGFNQNHAYKYITGVELSSPILSNAHILLSLQRRIFSYLETLICQDWL